MDKPSEPIRILIADDHPIFRDGLRRLLDAELGLRVVGEAADGAEALKIARQLKPHILLLDLAMPRLPGLEALRQITTSPILAHTIVLTAAIERSQIVEALQLGARGIVLKESTTDLLLKCIRSVMSGQYWVARGVVPDLVQYLQNLNGSRDLRPARRPFGLTPRELEIITAIVAGYTNRDMAQHLSISEQTVKHHLSSIFDKLGVSSRLELAIFAVSHKLVSDF